ncbi:MAG: hypothetical protein LUD52_03135, partial [Opitutae bacterium]|nr:hypothetical protein [Opitutae bacterium]
LLSSVVYICQRFWLSVVFVAVLFVGVGLVVAFVAGLVEAGSGLVVAGGRGFSVAGFSAGFSVAVLCCGAGSSFIGAKLKAGVFSRNAILFFEGLWCANLDFFIKIKRNFLRYFGKFFANFEKKLARFD